jgi:hypothetical protein
MKKLAIYGHPARGNEVIEILEMLGGTNRKDCWGVFKKSLYIINAYGDIEDKNLSYINTYGDIEDKSLLDDSKYQIYTLEEFLNKYPFKIGEKVNIAEYESEVRINEMLWKGNTVEYRVDTCYGPEWFTAEELKDWNDMGEIEEINESTIKKLAIKGHLTRGKEVIEILKTIGNIKSCLLFGDREDLWYFITSKGKIAANTKPNKNEYVFLTLEEFIEKYPYNVGDKVEYLGRKVTITKMVWDANSICYKLNDKIYTNEMDKLKPYKEKTNMTEINNAMLPETNDDGMLCYKIPDGYETFSVKDDVIILKPKKQTYPKNYIECYEVLNISIDNDKVKGYNSFLLENFQTLMVCRNAYWKIAGDEMGLGKPWEPNWNDTTQNKYGIHTVENQIRNINLKILKNLVLVFPTIELRDEFYHNFSEIIENCKELL